MFKYKFKLKVTSGYTSASKGVLERKEGGEGIEFVSPLLTLTVAVIWTLFRMRKC